MSAHTNTHLIVKELIRIANLIFDIDYFRKNTFLDRKEFLLPNSKTYLIG
jgi:hypothetical protein